MTPTVHGIIHARWLAAEKPNDGWVWPAPKASVGHMEANSIYEPHRKAVADSGVRPFVFYNLRHTFLTRLGERRGCVDAVRAWCTGTQAIGPRTRHEGACAELLQNWLQCQIGEKDKAAKTRKVLALSLRRGAGVAEQGCLLSSYPGKTGIGGSNPPLSAMSTNVRPGHIGDRTYRLHR
jgi:hypothetical protein